MSQSPPAEWSRADDRIQRSSPVTAHTLQRNDTPPNAAISPRANPAHSSHTWPSPETPLPAYESPSSDLPATPPRSRAFVDSADEIYIRLENAPGSAPSP